MSILIVTIGPPGAGKTSEVEKWRVIHPGKHIYISLDGLRQATGIGGNRETNPAMILEALLLGQKQLVAIWLRLGLDVAVDGTCQTQEEFDNWTRLAESCGATMVVWDFRFVSLDSCVENDRRRAAIGGRWVGIEAIRRVADRCIKVDIGDKVVVKYFG